MLVLTRKIGETVVVGNTIRITVLELSHGVVRLGFEAPPDVSIYREEIHREIARSNQAAFETSSPDRSD
jgi:carbon storage regulator